ncbi:MAG: hypothetical protein PWQ95_1976, partial [Thermococcaceae archaeon]|nr:hypothetical protein [Thermococcaceae archaeon]
GPEEALLNLSKRVRGIKGDKEHEEAVKKAGLKRMEEEIQLKNYLENIH